MKYVFYILAFQPQYRIKEYVSSSELNNFAHDIAQVTIQKHEYKTHEKG
jgi:hypothetical protein